MVESAKKEEDPPSFKEFLQSTKTIFKHEGRWLYAIFAIGGFIMFLLFGVLFYLSDNLEAAYQIKGVKKGLLLSIPLLFLSISSYVAGKTIGKEKGKMRIF